MIKEWETPRFLGVVEAGCGVVDTGEPGAGRRGFDTSDIKEFVKRQGAHEARAKFDAMISTEIKAQAARLALEQGRYPTPRAMVEVKTAVTAVKEAKAAAHVEAAAVQVKAQVEAAQVEAAQVEAAQVAAIQVVVAGVEEETIQAKQLRMF